MADNIEADAGSGGATFAADDISGVHYPRSKIVIGADGTNDGDVSSANPLPVKGTGTAGSANSGVLTVQGISSMTALQVADNSGSLTVDAPVGTPVFVQLSDGTDPITTLPVSLASVPSHAVTNAGTFAVQAAQSGTWNITNVSGTISLPTGAATAAKQPALGTAGSASSDVITVQGIASMTPLLVTLSGTNNVTNAGTFAVQAAQSGTWNITNISGTVSLPTGAATAAKQPALGTAGSASSDVITVQGIASMTPLLVTTQASTNTIEVVGDAAHGAAVAGNPLLQGLEGRSSDGTAIDSGDVVRALASLLGKQVTLPYAIPASTWSYASVSGGITDTSDDAARAAQGAGTRNYVTRCQVINGHATVSTEVVIKTASTILWRGFAQAEGGGCTIIFDPPLRGGDNEAINVANITTGSATYFNLQGYTAAE